MTDPPCPIGGIEVVESQGPEIPISSARSTEIWAEMVPPAPFSSSAMDRLKIAAELLRSHLNPADRWALDGEDAQHQMASAFRSLALVSYYLANFAKASSGFLPLELVEVKKCLKNFNIIYCKLRNK